MLLEVGTIAIASFVVTRQGPDNEGQPAGGSLRVWRESLPAVKSGGCRKPVCHAGRVPCVTSLDALHLAVAEFAVTDPGLVIEPRRGRPPGSRWIPLACC